jgi:hypothetical protein
VEDEEEVDELDDDTISNTDSRTSVGKVKSSASIDLSKAATRTPSPFPPAKTTPAKSTPGSAHSSLLPAPPPAWHWSSPESKLRRLHLVAEIEEKKKRRNQELQAIELAKKRKLAEAGRNMRLRALKDIEDRKAAAIAAAERAASTPPRVCGGMTSPLAAIWASSPVRTSAKPGERSKVTVKTKAVDVFCAKNLNQDSDHSEDSDDHDMAVDSDSDEEEADDEGGRDGRTTSTAKGDSRPVKSMSKKRGATKGKAKAQPKSSKSKSKSKSGSHRSKRERRNF